MSAPEWNSRRVLEELFTPETRRQAAEAFWEFDRFPTQVRKQVEELLIQVVKWRPQRFRSLPLHKKAEHLLAHLHHPALDAARWLVVAAYLELRVPDLVRDLNEFWGIEYPLWKEGQPVQTPLPPTPAQVAEGLLHYRDHYRPQQIAAFLAYNGMQSLQWREVLWPCIAGVLADGTDTGATVPHSTPPRAASEDAAFHEIPELTALDHLLVRLAIEAASAGDQPALERVARAMDELLRLVPGRQVAWFHQGVLRQLQASRPPAPIDGAARDWYLAGRICLLMERQAAQPLIALVDEEAEGVASLLSGGNGGAPICAMILATACWLEGRPEEAIGFLRPALLARLGSGMVHLLVTMAEDRLTAHGPREARLALERVLEVIDLLPAATFPRHFVDRLVHLRARCLRGEGCFAESQALLNGLLHCRSQGEVQADLGLAAGEFRWLSEVWVPATREQVPGLIERLRRGQEQYRTAIRISRDPALPEALYPLGLLALLEGEAELAVGHLEAACAEAVKHEARYLAGRLLARIQAVSGMALLLTLNEAHLGRAMERLRLADAVCPAAQWPSWLLSGPRRSWT